MQAGKGIFALLCAALTSVLGACTVDADADRAAWLANTLVEDNLRWLAREPDLVAEKLAKMESGPYAYFRGTAGQFHRDMSLPQYASRFLTASATEVLVLGDPHLENLGSYRGPDGDVLLDWNDFDSAGYGSYATDVRRLALSFAAAADDIGSGQVDDDEVLALVRTVAEAYVEEIEVMAAGSPTMRVRLGDEFGAIVDDLLVRARDKGDEADSLDDLSVLADIGRRYFRRGELEEPAASFAVKTLREPSEAERVLVDAAMADYRRRADSELGPVLDVVRRLGAGVSSFPMARFYVLCDGPTPATDDDRILELKEVAPSPIAERLTGEGRRLYGSDGERIVELMRGGQETPDNDPALGYAVVEPWSFRIRTIEGYQRGLDVERIGENLGVQFWRGDDLHSLAGTAGRALARVHGKSPTASGRSGAEAIHAAIGGDTSGFADEVVGFVYAYHPISRRDYQLFAALLDQLGPTLGAW